MMNGPVHASAVTVGRYRLQRRIGVGLLGPVFQATDDATDRTVALKILTIELSDDQRERLLEALTSLAAAPLNHPSIVKPLHVDRCDDGIYVVEEYVDSESLDVAIRGGHRFAMTDVLHVAAELAGAVDYAALLGVHHGSLGARDVLLNAGQTRITGFGIAQAVEHAGIAVAEDDDDSGRIRRSPRQRQSDIARIAVLAQDLLSASSLLDDSDDESRRAPEWNTAALHGVLRRALRPGAAAPFQTALEFVECLTCAALGAAPPNDETLQANAPVSDGFESVASDVRRENGGVPTRDLFAQESNPHRRHVGRSVIVALLVAFGIGAAGNQVLRHPDVLAGLGPHTLLPAAVATTASDQRAGEPSPTMAPTDLPASEPQAIDAQPSQRDLSASRSSAETPRTVAPARRPVPGGDEAGMLFVDSQPRGAKLFVDGDLVGETPLAIPTAVSGYRQIRLEHAGFAVWSSPVRVESNRLNRVLITLEQQ